MTAILLFVKFCLCVVLFMLWLFVVVIAYFALFRCLRWSARAAWGYWVGRSSR